MERNYEDKYNINLIGKTGEAIYKLPFYIMEIENEDCRACDQEYLFARYNPIDDCFYDERKRNGDYLKIQNGDLSKLKVGMLVEYSEFNEGWPEIVIPENPIINKELVERKKLDYDSLKEKYGDDSWFHRKYVSLETIINNYCEKRLDEGKEVDPYIADIIYVLGDEMGLKLKTGGKLYNNGGYQYPEEIEQVVAGLYELLSLKLQRIDPFIYPNEIYFNSYQYVNDNYSKFIKQVEYLSGINCGYSDIVNYIISESYHQSDEKHIKSLKRLSPKFHFGKNESYLDHDTNNPDSYKQIIKRGVPYHKWAFLKKLNPENEEKAKQLIR